MVTLDELLVRNDVPDDVKSILVSLTQELTRAQMGSQLGLLLDGVVHDVNNMLTVIVGYTHAITDHEEECKQILLAADHAAGVVKTSLSLRRGKFEKTYLDPNRIVTQLANMLKFVVGDEIRLDTYLDESVGYIWAGGLDQILVNLVINARDAIFEMGTISIKTYAETKDNESTIPTGSYVAIQVSDTGCGIENNLQERLFTSGYTTKEGSAGLGLATVCRLMEENRGCIDLKSKVDEGTSITLYFPAEDKPEADSFYVAPKDRQTILLVEDEAMLRSLVKKVLVKAGYKVLEECSGTDALQKKNVHRKIDLLITDVNLPGRSGIDVATTLQSIHPELPVLYISGYDLRNKLPEGARVLDKPFSPIELTKMVYILLGKDK